MTQAAHPEPAPTGQGEIVLDPVLRRVREMSPAMSCTDEPAMLTKSSLLHLHTDLIARAEMGHKKYGTLLRAHNGRSAAVDLYQELLDGIMYSMQAKLEDPNSMAASYFDLLVALAARLSNKL